MRGRCIFWMIQSTTIEGEKFPTCRYCDTPTGSDSLFCSESCKTRFERWLETEHAREKGKRPAYWNIIRRTILERDGYRCQICSDNTSLSVHHIIPLSSGGDSSFENLRVLCQHCHQKAHGRREPGRKKRKFRIRIRYQPMYVPAVMACPWMWENSVHNRFSVEQNRIKIKS